MANIMVIVKQGVVMFADGAWQMMVNNGEALLVKVDE